MNGNGSKDSSSVGELHVEMNAGKQVAKEKRDALGTALTGASFW